MRRLACGYLSLVRAALWLTRAVAVALDRGERRLSHNKLHHLRRDMFAGLEELQILQLDRCVATFASARAVHGGRAWCGRSLNSRCLTSMTCPVCLDVDGVWRHSNVIGSLEGDTFAGMPNLHQLALQNNRLDSIPSTLFIRAVRMSHLCVRRLSRTHRQRNGTHQPVRARVTTATCRLTSSPTTRWPPCARSHGWRCWGWRATGWRTWAQPSGFSRTSPSCASHALLALLARGSLAAVLALTRVLRRV